MFIFIPTYIFFDTVTKSIYFEEAHFYFIKVVAFLIDMFFFHHEAKIHQV